MALNELTFSSINAIAPKIKSGDVSPVELTEHMLERIHAKDQLLNSFITVTDNLARQQAERAEKEL